jgi:broad specificity phosphatase PhoE
LTHILFARHGETIWHKENRYAGSSDIALSPRGYKDAEYLANWARTARIDALWVSPLLRTQETASPVALATGLEPRIDPRLREVDFGQAEGHTIAELKHLLPEALEAFLADPAAHPFPGGEDLHVVAERAIACFYDIAEIYPDGRVLVVAHSSLLRLALCQLIGLPLSRYRSIFPFVYNCAITEIKLTNRRASLLMYNVPVSPRPEDGEGSGDPTPQNQIDNASPRPGGGTA